MVYNTSKDIEDSSQFTYNKISTQNEFKPKSFLDIVFTFYERMIEHEQEYQFLTKLDFGSFTRSLFESSRLRCRKMYAALQKHTFMLVKRRIDKSKILDSLKQSNIRFYFKDSDDLKHTILSEVRILCHDEKVIHLIEEQIDYYLKDGNKLLPCMEPAIRDVLEKGDSELADLILFYDCFKNNIKQKKAFLKQVSI